MLLTKSLVKCYYGLELWYPVRDISHYYISGIQECNISKLHTTVLNSLYGITVYLCNGIHTVLILFMSSRPAEVWAVVCGLQCLLHGSCIRWVASCAVFVGGTTCSMRLAICCQRDKECMKLILITLVILRQVEALIFPATVGMEYCPSILVSVLVTDTSSCLLFYDSVRQNVMYMCDMENTPYICVFVGSLVSEGL